MMQTVCCIRFGAVLMDESRQPLLLCENCHSDYSDLQEFQRHLRSCLGLEHLFQPNTLINFDCAKEATQLFSAAKQYLIYNFNEVQAIKPPSLEINYKNEKTDNYMDLIKIEEELLDPRWYTDLTSVQSEMTTATTATNTAAADKILEYNELVNSVTPFVQFKENVRTSNLSSIKAKKTKDLVETKLLLNANGTQQNSKKMNSKQGAAKNIVGNVKIINQPIAKRRLSMQKPVTTASNGKPFNTLPLEQSNAKLKLLQKTGKDVLTQKLSTQKPEPSRPKPIAKRRKTIAIAMENIQIQPEELLETEDFSWKRDIAQILAKPKSNLKTYQIRERSSLPQQHTSKTVSFQEAAPAITTTLKCAVPPPRIPPPALYSQQKPQKVAIESKPLSVATTIPVQVLPPAAIEKKQTEQILNKLQTLGLQVKRTNPPPRPPPPPPPAPTKADKTLELLRKLQSKGMNVKILNANTSAAIASHISKKPKLNLGSTATALTQQAISTNATKSKFNKGIIIKKVK